MGSSADSFKNAIDKAFTTEPGVKINSDTMGDAIKYKSGFTEGEDDDYKYETFLEKNKRQKQSAKNQFTKDLSQDKDYLDFKKNSEYEDERGVKYSFGTPNASYKDPYINKKKYSRIDKLETVEATGTGSSGGYSAPLFSGEEIDLEKAETKEATGSGSSGAFSGPVAFKDSQFVRNSFKETPKLKEETEKVEATEATGSGSVGGYETPAMWAKSTKKKDWGPSRKTQIPGGGFVKIKKKCTKFPYCNQGDINNLKISKNESVKDAIENVAKKMGISKNVIMTILEHEYEKINKRTK